MVKLTKLYENNLKALLIKQGIEPDLVDIKALWDNTLTYYENKNNIINDVKEIDKDQEKHLRQEAEKQYIQRVNEEEEKEIEKIKDSETTDILNRIYWELHKKIEVFLKGDRKLMIVIGDQGIGKTFQVLRQANKRSDRVKINRGVSTPAGLNDWLGEFSDDHLLILDDVEGWVEDLKAVSILKAGSEKPFTVVWNTKDKRVQHTTWKNNSKWIIIMNYKPSRPIWKPIFSRAYICHIKLGYKDKLKLLYEIAKIRKLPIEIVNFIKDNSNPSTEFDIRTLEKASEFMQFKMNWQRLILTELKCDEGMDFIIRMQEEGFNKKDILKKFKEEGYGSQRTFYRLCEIALK